MEFLMPEQTSTMSRIRRRMRHTARLLRRASAYCLANRDRSGALYDPYLAEHSWRVLFINLVSTDYSCRRRPYYGILSPREHADAHFRQYSVGSLVLVPSRIL